MNFGCVGIDSKGQYYMKFNRPFTIVEKIQLLQRSILVNSFVYYELNDNLLPDFKYDANVRQLEDLKRDYPKEFKRSRYYTYFYDYFNETDESHYTSGFDLLDKVRKDDPQLYHYIRVDACMALDRKNEYRI